MKVLLLLKIIGVMLLDLLIYNWKKMYLSNLNRIKASFFFFFYFHLGQPDFLPHLHYVSMRLMNTNILFTFQIISLLPYVVL